MMIMENVLDYARFVGADPQKYYKTTLFSSPRFLLGLNCLEPGQAQAPHQHADQDKFYFVLEGQGTFSLGTETIPAGKGNAVWAAAGMVHGVANTGGDRLVLLVGIAPSPAAG
jgi:quercetin dioxygenase-like cupin family protein